MPQMTPEQRDDFLRGTRIAKLITLYADGAPTAVPIWFEWDGERARMFTARGSEKVRRIQADPRAALTVETSVGEPEAWVTIEGTAAILDEGGMDLARRLAYRYYERAKAERTLAEWERLADRWVVIELTPRRIRSMT